MIMSYKYLQKIAVTVSEIGYFIAGTTSCLNTGSLSRLTVWLMLPVFMELGSCASGGNKIPEHPNILVIITDQQSASMMSCTGNPWLKTPAMDAIASAGMRFTCAYATNPVCVPSRFSLQTGRFRRK